MKQRLVMVLVILGTILLLIGLNAASYVQQEKMPDTEVNPNRSTFNSGATGTQALFTLLTETGRKAIRWQEPSDTLASARNKPAVFVIIGRTRREITDVEAGKILKWVAGGGRLVLIDRDPPESLLTSTIGWRLSISTDPAANIMSADPTDQKQMTSGTTAARPIVPSIYTVGVNAVQHSRFAGWMTFERMEGSADYDVPAVQTPTRTVRLAGQNEPFTFATPTPMTIEQLPAQESLSTELYAPVVHLAGDQKNLVVDVPYGTGTIVFLTDPYVVSNSGLGVVDNAQLAINLVVPREGVIAFDEYHQGYGSNNNRLLSYFEGTPLVAIVFQAAMLITLVFYSKSRRFARPLPDRRPDRLSKLEYVTAMAELQRRSKAFDLAIENIYTDFRRRAARSFGLDNTMATRAELAERIAERTGLDSGDIDRLMYRCEDVIHGEPIGASDAVKLASGLREIEDLMGLGRARQEGKTSR